MGFIIIAYSSYNDVLPIQNDPIDRMDWFNELSESQSESEDKDFMYGITYGEAEELTLFLGMMNIPELKLLVDTWSNEASADGFIFAKNECLTILQGLNKTTDYFYLESNIQKLARLYCNIGILKTIFYNSMYGFCVFR